MQQEEKIAESLYELSTQLVGQINSSERHLAPISWFPTSSSFPDPKVELKKIDNFLVKMRKHPGHEWLAKQPDFDRCLHLFEKEVDKSKESELDISRKKMRLLHAIAGCGWQILDESSWIPRKFSKSEKVRVIEIATELLNFTKEGLGRPDYPIMKNLEEPLMQFIDHMQTATKREYTGLADRQREVAIRFTLCLRDFGLKRSKVVELLESTFLIFDIDLGHRTAQNYVREGFAR
jgi:hypothetical protein